MNLVTTATRQDTHSNVVVVIDERESQDDPYQAGPSAVPGPAIPFPCCPKEVVVVFTNAHGNASMKCPNCGKIALFDYDALTSKRIHAFRGAYKHPVRR